MSLRRGFIAYFLSLASLQYSQPFLPFQRTFASSSRGEGKHDEEEGDGRRRVGGMNEKERGRRPMPWRVGVVAVESYRVFDCPLRVIFRSALHFQKYMIHDCNNWFGGHFLHLCLFSLV